MLADGRGGWNGGLLKEPQFLHQSPPYHVLPLANGAFLLVHFDIDKSNDLAFSPDVKQLPVPNQSNQGNKINSSKLLVVSRFCKSQNAPLPTSVLKNLHINAFQLPLNKHSRNSLHTIQISLNQLRSSQMAKQI